MVIIEGFYSELIDMEHLEVLGPWAMYVREGELHLYHYGDEGLTLWGSHVKARGEVLY